VAWAAYRHCQRGLPRPWRAREQHGSACSHTGGAWMREHVDVQGQAEHIPHRPACGGRVNSKSVVVARGGRKRRGRNCNSPAIFLALIKSTTTPAASRAASWPTSPAASGIADPSCHAAIPSPVSVCVSVCVCVWVGAAFSSLLYQPRAHIIFCERVRAREVARHAGHVGRGRLGTGGWGSERVRSVQASTTHPKERGRERGGEEGGWWGREMFSRR
jgi:hypothetical protein